MKRKVTKKSSSNASESKKKSRLKSTLLLQSVTLKDGRIATPLPDGTLEIESGGYGRTVVILADGGRPRRIDVSAAATGWERLRDFFARRRNG
jgi:hypothetical protein